VVKALLPKIVVAALLSVSACSGGSLERGPSDTLRSYAEALEDKRIDDAYRLLSDDAKRTISLEAFRRMVTENPDDVLEVARALARPSTDPDITATVVMPNGDELKLVLEDGRWRVDATAIDLYGQATPRQALLGFLRAFERKRYDVVLRYVPDSEREGVTATSPAPVPPSDAPAPPPAQSPPAAGAEKPPAPTSPAPSTGGELTVEKLRDAWEGPQKEQMQRVVQAIKAAIPTASIEENGDTAAMSYGTGGTVSFVRERGAWKIRDF
jgi:hypothetical protein